MIGTGMFLHLGFEMERVLCFGSVVGSVWLFGTGIEMGL